MVPRRVRLMENQREEILRLVEEQRRQGRGVGEILATVGICRSSYYRWRKRGCSIRKSFDNSPSLREVTLPELKRIEALKEARPHLRHRQIQGFLQAEGLYLGATTVYQHLKRLGKVEAFGRRPSPLKEAVYEVWQKNWMWGCDWTKLLIAGIRWYLLTLIDFFSRYLIAFSIVPTVHAGCVKALYWEGLKNQGIGLKVQEKPDLRVDRGSPNTSWVTREFFEIIGADLSFARVRRPTDNAITERFYGTVKQEEIYLVGNYPDELSAKEEIGKYIAYYNNERPHQALWNFTPAFVHQTNNKTLVLEQLQEIKQKTLEARKNYWREQQKNDSLKNLILSH